MGVKTGSNEGEETEVFIMGSEPLPNVSAAEVKGHFGDNPSKQDLATAFAITSNQFWYVEDNKYDYEEGSIDWGYACAIADEWSDLADYYRAKIFSLLEDEGVSIPSNGQIVVLIPFMKRYGYADAAGWWIKEK